MIFKGVADFIGRHDRFIITAHESPDGDAVGSEYAMARALLQLGKQVRVCNADPMPGKWKFIDDEGLINCVTSAGDLPDDIEQWALLILDTNDTTNIGAISELVLPRVREHFIIDHHDHDEDLVGQNLIQQSASSTAEIVYQVLLELKVDINFTIARALFAAIVFDTGSFVYPKTTALTFDIARDLVERGVSPYDVYASVYESNSVSSLMLQSRVLASLELFMDNRVAVQHMSKQTLEDCGARYDEAETIINGPLRSESVRVSVFFKQNEEGRYRCSLRSKGEVNCVAIAADFGGGGHRTAAGFRLTSSYDVTRKQLLERLQAELAALDAGGDGTAD